MIGGRPFVAVVGDVGLDVVARPSGPVAVGSDTRSDVRLTHGGAGANTAAWLVACGAAALLVGRIGRDEAATLVRAELDRVGIQAALAVDDVRPTCCVVVVVDESAKRTMFPSRGASGAISAADLAGADLTSVDHLHLSGYVLLDPTSREAGLAALERARLAGLSTSVDPQAAALITSPEQFLTDVRGIDLLLPNEDELLALAGAPGLEATRRLLNWVGAVAFTSGHRGATWVDRDRWVQQSALGLDVVDPTGAGDAFNAGLLVAWLTGATPADALAAGVRAGASAAAGVGARPGPELRLRQGRP